MLKIIVVDDEQSSINQFIEKFVIDGFDIDAKYFLSMPLNAPDYAKKTRIDVAFLDIHMPKINGVDLAEKLIEINKSIKIVFISGYEQNMDSLSAKFGENLIGFYSKPYQDHELRNLINILIHDNKKNIKIQCKDCFNIFVNNLPIKFATKKSREILAYLVFKKGAVISSDLVITDIWGGENVDKSKLHYKDNLYLLRKTLKEWQIDHILHNSRGMVSIDTENIDCDYLDFATSHNNIELLEHNFFTEFDWMF